MIINTLEIQLQTVFYLEFSKQNNTLVQASILQEKILLVDKCDNHRVTSQIWQLLHAACYGPVGKANGRARTFFFGGGSKKVRIVFSFFGWDFLSPRNYKSFRYRKLSQRQYVLLH